MEDRLQGMNATQGCAWLQERELFQPSLCTAMVKPPRFVKGKGGPRIDSYTRGKQIQGGKLVLNHIHPQKVKAKGVVAFLCNL
jgi:hypothetical protein